MKVSEIYVYDFHKYVDEILTRSDDEVFTQTEIEKILSKQNIKTNDKSLRKYLKTYKHIKIKTLFVYGNDKAIAKLEKRMIR